MLNTILLVFAFVCECLAAVGVSHPRINLGWLGLAFGFLSMLLGRG